MELVSDFVVGVEPKVAWDLLTDVERIAPCMPGAELQEVEGDEYRGVVKVKVGPITSQYKGKATFLERDEDARRVVLRAEGRETRGQGHASATVTATLAPEGDGTRVNVVTDLSVTGKAAQFGRGVLADVSANLMGQFASCLEKKLLAGDAVGAEGPAGATDAAGATAAPPETTPAAAPTTPAATPSVTAAAGAGPRRVEHARAAPVDLFEAAGAPVAKRVLPVVAGLALAWLLRGRIRRLFRSRG